MEVVSENGSKTQIKPGQIRELGRDHGLNSSDKTISRRQVSFFIPRVAENQETLTRFEVLGRNPIYVSKGNVVKIYRRFDKGEMGDGDMFCVSAKNPVWYTLRKTEDGCSGGVRRNDSESELAANSEREFGFEGIEDFQHESVDNSDVDPVKEFGFLVIGHEFDSYPEKMIRDIKNWNWFIEETKKDIEDDDDDDGKRGKGKRKKGLENDDDEWTGESEDDKVLINKSRKAQKPKYTTRSKDRGGSSKGSTGKIRELDDDEEDGEEDEDEEDETLGGFIVDDEKLDEDEEIGDEEEEEESVDEYDEDE